LSSLNEVDQCEDLSPVLGSEKSSWRGDGQGARKVPGSDSSLPCTGSHCKTGLSQEQIIAKIEVIFNSPSIKLLDQERDLFCI